MMNISQSRQYDNFLESRKQETSNLLWISRRWNPKIAFKQGSRRPTPASHKEAVLQSPIIQELLDELYKNQNVPKSELEKQVRAILDEIGYDRKMKVVRWLGLALTKICLKVVSGLYINPTKVQEIKSLMGNCPVVFVPSHRSYADFILMAYVAFTYDIEIPAVAAGMDFHGMWGMGTVLRDTGAFFMRRSYNDDSLYWTTFKQYIYQLVTKADVPIEFFLEGTRSRSNKSLAPKFGLLSMILKALFLSQVPDILFVPISINYDRILEENLFTYELLGVPKPKETTTGFFKSLKIIKETFGDIYIHIDEAISARTFFEGKIERTVHNVGPIHLQELTEEEKNLVPQLANEIILRQQKNSVLSVFNLMAVVINDNFGRRRQLFTMDELTEQILSTKKMLEMLGCVISITNLEKSIKDAFTVHSNLIGVDSENKVCLVSNEVTQDKINPLKLKGYALSDKTMTYSVPFVMLQIYVNPSLQYFIDMAILGIILDKRSSLIKDELFQTYHFLRSLFAKEFVTFIPTLGMEFEAAINNGFNFRLIECRNGSHYELGTNENLKEFLLNAVEPFMLSYFTTFTVLQELVFKGPSARSYLARFFLLKESITQKRLVVSISNKDRLLEDVLFYVPTSAAARYFSQIIKNTSLPTDEKSVLAKVQQILEKAINSNNEFVHPYCLNLDTLANCLSTLCNMDVLKKSRRDNKNIYSVNSELLKEMRRRFEIYIPECHINKSDVLNITLQNKL